MLGDSITQCKTNFAAIPNTKLASILPSWYDENDPRPLAVPIVSLEVKELERWANMTMAKRSISNPCLLIDRHPESDLPPVFTTLLSSRVRLDDFVRSASREALDLLAALVAIQFNVAIMRLVQRVVLGGRALQSQLAEVLLSGLVERVASDRENSQTEYSLFKVCDDMVPLLEPYFSISDKVDIQRALSEFIHDHMGEAIDFEALVYSKGGWLDVPSWVLPFAKASLALSDNLTLFDSQNTARVKTGFTKQPHLPTDDSVKPKKDLDLLFAAPQRTPLSPVHLDQMDPDLHMGADEDSSNAPSLSGKGALEVWLSYAPKPSQLKHGHLWHIFFCHRSVNRYWVLELYDILRQLGYSVFLDQYVLSGASPLTMSLSEALDVSACAILVWSDQFEDSAWCMQQLGELLQRETKEPDFGFVIAKLDKAVLPMSASQKIYVDFSDGKQGPGGSDILRVLYGLVKAPLPEQAIKLAAEVDEEISQARLSIAAARLDADVDTLLQLASSTTLAWLNSPMLGCAVADALIALNKNDEALHLATKLCTDFPKTARPKQLQGLAQARKGNWRAAQTILGGLYVAGEVDPETLGIYARTWMDRYKDTKDIRYLLKSRDLYRQAFETDRNDYYTGINAATKSLLLGEIDTCAELAARVEKIVGTVAVPSDYWRTATIAEIQLMQRNYARAGELYQAAVICAPEEIGSHFSVFNQAKLILSHLNASAEEYDLALGAFSHIANSSAT